MASLKQQFITTLSDLKNCVAKINQWFTADSNTDITFAGMTIPSRAKWLSTVSKGDKGEAGADSTVPGPKGEAGADSAVPGPKGEAGADSVVPGPKGEAGANSVVPGPKGEAGADSVVPGPKGDLAPDAINYAKKDLSNVADADFKAKYDSLNVDFGGLNVESGGVDYDVLYTNPSVPSAFWSGSGSMSQYIPPVLVHLPNMPPQQIPITIGARSNGYVTFNLDPGKKWTDYRVIHVLQGCGGSRGFFYINPKLAQFDVEVCKKYINDQSGSFSGKVDFYSPDGGSFSVALGGTYLGGAIDNKVSAYMSVGTNAYNKYPFIARIYGEK